MDARPHGLEPTASGPPTAGFRTQNAQLTAPPHHRTENLFGSRSRRYPHGRNKSSGSGDLEPAKTSHFAQKADPPAAIPPGGFSPQFFPHCGGGKRRIPNGAPGIACNSARPIYKYRRRWCRESSFAQTLGSSYDYAGLPGGSRSSDKKVFAPFRVGGTLPLSRRISFRGSSHAG